MKISEIRENIVIAYSAMASNKVRSALASLGVVIGISTVILMGWILSGLQTALDDTFKMMGVDVLYIDKWDWTGGKNWKDIKYRKNITLDQVNEIRSKIQTAELTFTSTENWGQSVKYGNQNFNGINIAGITYEHGRTPAGETLLGRYFTQFEQYNHSNVAVIGYKVYQTIFSNEDPLGKDIKINGHKFIIIGVVKKQGTLMFDFVDNKVYLPLEQYFSTFGKYDISLSVGIKAGGEENIDKVREESRGLMRIIRNLKPHQEDDFSINETKAFEKQTAQLKLYVWGIGIGMTVLSFLVGIIGIMNIMFVSVTERTKEIGIRKAIGAKKRSILFQFIFEAAVLSLSGAFFSLIICSGLVYLVATILPTMVPETAFLKPFLPYQLFIIASLVSIMVGVAAGFVPAQRAANLDPIEALRFE